MPEMMFCGAGSFKDVDKEAADAGGSGGGKPARSKKKGKDNPYATRGLDKFSTVMSELESRRERILRRAGPGVDAGHLMVRFVQSEAKGWVPIVVKLPPEQQDAKKSKQQAAAPATPPTEPASPKEAEDAAKHVVPAAKVAAPVRGKKKAGGEGWPWSSGRKVMRPLQYWPLAAALLLLSLVVFGRVFAICCTSIWWYLLPILTGDEDVLGAERSPPAVKARKDLVKKARDKFSAAPAAAPPSHGKKSSYGAAPQVISPRSHAHRKKG